MILEVLLSLLLIIIGYFLYYYKKIHYRFDSAGIKYLPGIPIFGNVWRSVFLMRHFIDDLQEVYDAFPEEKYVGFADGMVPVILVRDPDLMKTITVKDFDHFQNRKETFPVRVDPLIGRNVLQLKDEKWKIMRTQLSPAFTPARLRYMMPAMIQVSKNVVESLKKYCCQEVELSECMYRYTGDSVAAAAFGFDQGNAGREDSLFSKLSADIYLDFYRKTFKFIGVQFPKTSKIIYDTLNLRILPNKIYNFLRQLVSNAIEYRKENNMSMSDYMDVILKHADGKSIDEIAGQFLFAYATSLESGSGTLRLCFHELALNPEIQERLYQEIREHEKSTEITMESINELKYLDCVFNETSRRWSAAIMMDRICSKPYVLPPPRDGGNPYKLERGDMVFNVINQIQMDPKYFKDPKKFDPDRFSEENKHLIQSFTFLPFGIGPRGCLGARFSVLQLKVMIYHMLLAFRLVKCQNTSDPIELEPDEMGIIAKGGTWVRLELRR